MEVEEILSMVRAYLPMPVQFVLMGLGALVVIGLVYVKVTPSKEDDAWFEALEKKPFIGHILKFFIAFSPIQRKDKVEGFDDTEARDKSEESKPKE